ncbi:hypothetical protein [Vibrio sp. WXL210]|uniref:hypothetical protein n=1 Tax=Vibrio sp. WXL210 TaxID=3450709 RepID=UPI003EC55650
MTITPKQGRPKLTETVKLERKVAGQYIKLIGLRKQLRASVVKMHPSLTSAQQESLIQPILTAAEEYRFWSQLDNDLLAIQRHACAQTRFEQLNGAITRLLDQLINSYELIFFTRQELEQAKSGQQPQQIEHWADVLNQIKSQSVITQTQRLYQLARHLHTLLNPTFQIEQVTSVRAIIRSVLILIKHYRLNVVYRCSLEKNQGQSIAGRPSAGRPLAGRPSIPLPIQVVRAEEELIVLFNQLTLLYKYHQQEIPTPRAIAEKYHRVRSSSLGRPKLSERQKLEKAIVKKQQEITNLLDTHVDSAQPETQSPPRRGRKPLTFEQKYQKLMQELSALKLQIE